MNKIVINRNRISYNQFFAQKFHPASPSDPLKINKSESVFFAKIIQNLYSKIKSYEPNNDHRISAKIPGVL